MRRRLRRSGPARPHPSSIRPHTRSACLPAALRCRYSTSQFSQPWALTLVGATSASRLPSGELLVQFGIEWPDAGAQSVPILIANGVQYSRSYSGIGGHSGPRSATLYRTGVVAGL